LQGGEARRSVFPFAADKDRLQGSPPPRAQQNNRQLSSTVHTKLLENVMQMDFDRALTHFQFLRHSFIRQTVANQGRHLAFTIG
jgi:hypothetical protein